MAIGFAHQVPLAKPRTERLGLIRGLREKSKAVVQAKAAQIMDVNQDAVVEAMRTQGVTRLIHGHTHRPGHHVFAVDGRPVERWVLPDWYGPGGYLEVGPGAPKLIRF